MTQEYDSPWKEALHVYFPQFLELLFPEVYLAIDWSLGWQVKETELLSPAAGPRRVDVLMQVTMRGGTATFILIHIEVQNQTKHIFTRAPVARIAIVDNGPSSGWCASSTNQASAARTFANSFGSSIGSCVCQNARRESSGTI